MKFKVEYFGDAKPKWGTTVRSVLVSLLFFVGIISVIASGAPNSLIPPEKIQDEQLVQVHQRVAELEQDIAQTSKAIAVEQDPESKAILIEGLTKSKEQLEYNKNYLESVKNARETGTCFTADMKVLTENGAKPIGEIKVGDRVLSVDADGTSGGRRCSQNPGRPQPTLLPDQRQHQGHRPASLFHERGLEKSQRAGEGRPNPDGHGSLRRNRPPSNGFRPMISRSTT